MTSVQTESEVVVVEVTIVDDRAIEHLGVLQLRIGQDHDDRAKGLRDLSGRCHDLKALVYARGRHHHMGCVTVLAKHGG